MIGPTIVRKRESELGAALELAMRVVTVMTAIFGFAMFGTHILLHTLR